MDVLSTLGTVIGGLGAAASGGLTGIVGTGVKLFADQYAESKKLSHDVQMREYDLKEIQLEHDLQMKDAEASAKQEILLSELTLESEENAVSGETLIASYATDKASYGGGFVDWVRGLMRPVLTLYFSIVMSVIAYELFSLNEGNWVDSAQAQLMLNDVVNSLIFLGTLTATWWFGSRPSKRH